MFVSFFIINNIDKNLKVFYAFFQDKTVKSLILEDLSMLLPSLAKKIIEEVSKLTEEHLIMTNKDGTIIASTLPERIGQFHEGAYLACLNKEKIEISKEDEARLKGVKAGISLPIFFHQEVIGVIGITGEPKLVESYGELLKKMTELLIHESYYNNHKDWMQRAYQMFLFDWINEAEWTEDFHERAHVLNIDLHTEKRVILGSIETLSTPNDRYLLSDLQNFFEEEDTMFFQWGQQKIVILLNERPKRNKLWIKHFLEQIIQYCSKYHHQSPRFGIGHVVSSFQLKESFLQAERALKATTNELNFVFEDELGLEMCIQDISSKTKIQFINRVIGPILKEKELLDTLRMLIKQNNSLKETANALHIHINTLHYRIKKIEELTNYHPKYVKDSATLYLAITFLDEHPNILSDSG